MKTRPLFISRTDRLLIDYNFYTFTLQKQIFPKHDSYMSRTPQKANLNKSIGYDILTDSSSYNMDSFYQNRHHCFRIGFSSLLTPALTRVQKRCQHMSPSFGVIYDFAPKLSLVMIASLKHLHARYPKCSLSHHERHMKLLFYPSGGKAINTHLYHSAVFSTGSLTWLFSLLVNRSAIASSILSSSWPLRRFQPCCSSLPPVNTNGFNL